MPVFRLRQWVCPLFQPRTRVFARPRSVRRAGGRGKPVTTFWSNESLFDWEPVVRKDVELGEPLGIEANAPVQGARRPQGCTHPRVDPGSIVGATATGAEPRCMPGAKRKGLQHLRVTLPNSGGDGLTQPVVTSKVAVMVVDHALNFDRRGLGWSWVHFRVKVEVDCRNVNKNRSKMRFCGGFPRERAVFPKSFPV